MEVARRVCNIITNTGYSTRMSYHSTRDSCLCCHKQTRRSGRSDAEVSSMSCDWRLPGETGELGRSTPVVSHAPFPLILPISLRKEEDEMAAATISIEQDQFSCSVCLEVLRDPVTIPCGHSYCLECIEDYWNGDKQKNQYSCPQCRQVFNPRPLLSRNTVLGEVVEKFLQSGRQAKQQPAARAKEVKCTVCSGRRATAVRSCLTCAQSYCAAHLKAHDASARGKAHRLGSPVDQPGEKPCPQHRRPLRLFCRTDQQYVCSQCVKERHKSHDAVSLVEERAAQQVCSEICPYAL